MKPPLKLNSIDQEHLQELYNAAGVARDELPYTTAFEEIVAGFQDRTFKNADAEQLFGALLKYTRSSGNVATEQPPVALSDDQLKQLKAALSRHLIGGKILPYSDEFNAARAEFIKASGSDMPEGDFWRRSSSRKAPSGGRRLGRKSPSPRKTTKRTESKPPVPPYRPINTADPFSSSTGRLRVARAVAVWADPPNTLNFGLCRWAAASDSRSGALTGRPAVTTRQSAVR